MRPGTLQVLIGLAIVIASCIWLVKVASAWPVGSYRGHDTGYYSANGNYYAMDWTHSHSVGSGTCKSGHQHHYSGWLRTPGGYYVRLDDHDHHVCAPRH